MRRRRASVLPFGVVLCALLFAGAGALLLSERDGDGAAFEPTPRRRPLAYRILYRVEDHTAGGFRISWEERTVERPFAGSTVATDERPPSRAGARGNVTTRDRVYALGEDGLREVSARVPGVSGSDHAIAEVVDEAVQRRLARRMEEGRSVLGRSCRVYRTAEPPTGPLQPLRADDHADVCIDVDGLLLWEEWVLDRSVVRVREAVEVDVRPARAKLDGALSTRDAMALEPGLTAVRLAGPGAALPAFLPTPPTPRGFGLAGVVGIIVPLALANPDAPAEAVLYTSKAWVFARGPDVISIEAGSGGLGWSTRDASAAVHLAGLGPARSVIGVDGAELRVDLGTGRWVRIRGTMSASRLAAYAAGLTLRL